MKQYIPLFNEFINERSSSEIPKKKYQWVQVDPKDYDDLKDEFFELIQTAYKEIGGHLKVKDSDDVFTQDWNVFKAVDIDNKPDFEVVRFGTTTQFGQKSAGVGHDGSKEAKRTYIKSLADDLHKRGYYVEVSGKIAEILINKYDVQVINDPFVIETIVGRTVEYIGKIKNTPGDGWYSRKIGGKQVNKILVGRPLINESIDNKFKKPCILILHGYESSHNPPRLKKLQQYDIINPKLNFSDPNLFNEICKIIATTNPDLIVGSSMGGYLGYYVAKKTNVPALLFNPAMIETNTGAIKPIIIDYKSNVPITIISGVYDAVVDTDKLERWFKQNYNNYVFVKEQFEHQIPDNIYIKYVNDTIKK